MFKIAKNYYHELLNAINSVGVTTKEGNALDFYKGIEAAAANAFQSLVHIKKT